MRNLVVSKRQTVSLIFRKIEFQHPLHILSLKVCSYSINPLADKQERKYTKKKEKEKEERRKKKLFLMGSQHLDEGMTY